MCCTHSGPQHVVALDAEDDDHDDHVPPDDNDDDDAGSSGNFICCECKIFARNLSLGCN